MVSTSILQTLLCIFSVPSETQNSNSCGLRMGTSAEVAFDGKQHLCLGVWLVDLFWCGLVGWFVVVFSWRTLRIRQRSHLKAPCVELNLVYLSAL